MGQSGKALLQGHGVSHLRLAFSRPFGILFYDNQITVL
jgi:hypothetical protein